MCVNEYCSCVVPPIYSEGGERGGGREGGRIGGSFGDLINLRRWR